MKLKKIVILLVCLFSSGMLSAQNGVIRIYKGNSTYSGNTIYTFDGRYVYKGRSTYSGNVLYTYDGRHVFKGRSTYSGSIIYTTDAPVPLPVLYAICF